MESNYEYKKVTVVYKRIWTSMAKIKLLEMSNLKVGIKPHRKSNPKTHLQIDEKLMIENCKWVELNNEILMNSAMMSLDYMAVL